MVEKMIENSNILVTGGMGFIGSHIVNKLNCNNNKIIILDNLITTDRIEDENITYYLKNMGSVDYSDLLKDIDYVFHLGAKIDVIESFENPYDYYSTNSNSTLKLLEGARKTDVKKIIFSSSASVYGDVNGTLSEDITPKPGSPYGLSKYISELYLKNYFENYGIQYVSLRYFNVYGPKQRYYEANDVVTKFILSMLKNTSPSINGDGKQTRDFVYIDDVVNANIHFAKLDFNGEVNIGTGKETSVLDLFYTLKNIFNFQSEPVYKNIEASEIINSKADIALMQKLGFEITNNSLEDNLERIIQWYKDIDK